MDNPKEYLFVYGTLLSGASNTMAELLKSKSRYVGQGTFPGRLYDLGSYPGAIHRPECGEVVHGEIVELLEPGMLLKRLDEYEGATRRFGYLFERKQVKIVCEGKELNCWIYLYNRSVSSLTLIPSGEYRAG